MPPKKKPTPAAVYVIKFTLRGIRPPIWRRLQIGDAMTLHELHEAFQIVMSWKDKTLHQFQIAGTRYGEPTVEGYLNVKDDRKFTLTDMAFKVGTKFLYAYDFGDNWELDVEVEEVLPYTEGQPLPLCIKGKRAGPPEGVGGAWGYGALLEAKAKPTHPERIKFAKLIAEYNPEAFDLDALNQALRKRFGA